MACFERASPALKEILLRIYNSEKLQETDQHLYEFGSVHYHVQASASEPYQIYLSVATPLLSQGEPVSDGLPDCILKAVNTAYSDIMEVIEPPKEGYQLTLRIDIAKFPQNKEDCLKLITDISSLQSMILSSQLKEMFWFLGSKDNSHGMYKPIKLTYHPRDPIFVIRLPKKITVVFPMRFKDNSDVIIATTLFQELTLMGCSGPYAKAPPCTWSPIPPSELRGESFEDLNTNGGFVSFDIYSSHVKGSKLDKTVWNLLNFYAYVKYHIKCTRGFIQRSMRKRVESLSEVIQGMGKTGDETNENVNVQGKKTHMKKLESLSRYKVLKRKCITLAKKIKRIRSTIKIHGFNRFRQQWLKLPQYYSLKKTPNWIDYQSNI